jgi:hypothetical protein
MPLSRHSAASDGRRGWRALQLTLENPDGFGGDSAHVRKAPALVRREVNGKRGVAQLLMQAATQAADSLRTRVSARRPGTRILGAADALELPSAALVATG